MQVSNSFGLLWDIVACFLGQLGFASRWVSRGFFGKPQAGHGLTEKVVAKLPEPLDRTLLKYIE